jgi:hypothetical protein
MHLLQVKSEMVRLCPRPLRFPERTVLGWHLDLSAMKKLLDREYLHAREVPPPSLRAVVPGAYGLLLHRPAGLLQGEEDPNLRLLPDQRTDQVTDVPGPHLARLHLHEHPLGRAAFEFEEVYDSVYPLVRALLAGLASRFVRAERLGPDERERPPLELVAVVRSKLASAGEVLRLPFNLDLDAGEHVLQAVLHKRYGEVGARRGRRRAPLSRSWSASLALWY